jgi:putative ABC transport system substrate-binding protein
MKRREFVVGLGVAAAWPFPAGAEQEKRISRVGLVSLHAESLASHVDSIRQELQKLGYVDGSVKIDAHFTNGDKPRTRAILKSFIESRMDVIVAWTTPTVQLAREATETVPIVMIASDPVAAGLVASLSRPGGNITGVSMSGPDLAGKRLELLREIRPGIGTIAFLGYAPAPGAAAFVHETQINADQIGMKVVVSLVQRVEDVNAALFAGMKQDGAEAVVVQPFFTGNAAEISAFGLSTGLPIISDYPSFAKAGAIASLGVDLGAQVKRTAYYIDRILKGAKPADLPVEQPTKFELVINTNTARTLGLALPPNLLIRADEVIE